MKKTWIGAGVFIAVLLSFILSESFWNTLSRKKAVHEASRALSRLEQEIESAHKKITRLENNPQAFEELVRRELGYMRPQEKEVRFLDRKNH